MRTPINTAALLTLSIACIAASVLVDRFAHELCHRGLPLAALMVGIPIMGASAGAWSLYRRSRPWVAALKLASIAVNGYQLMVALLLLTGVGIVACG